MAFIWTLYVLWAAINAYFNDGPPSERFQGIFDFVTPPRQITVGLYAYVLFSLLVFCFNVNFRCAPDVIEHLSGNEYIYQRLHEILFSGKWAGVTTSGEQAAKSCTIFELCENLRFVVVIFDTIGYFMRWIHVFRLLTVTLPFSVVDRSCDRLRTLSSSWPSSPWLWHHRICRCNFGAVCHTSRDISRLFPGPSVLHLFLDISCEIVVVVVEVRRHA